MGVFFWDADSKIEPLNPSSVRVPRCRCVDPELFCQFKLAIPGCTGENDEVLWAQKMFFPGLKLSSPSMTSHEDNKSRRRILWISEQFVYCKDKIFLASDQKQSASTVDCKPTWRTQWLAAAATLVAIIISPAPAQAWPEKGSVTHKEDENGKYAIVDFKHQNCKISGSLAEGLDLYGCFAYLSGDANLISITYLIEGDDVQIKKRVKCKLSDNPNQALIFHPRYKDNQSRKSLASTVKRRNVEQDSSGRYDAAITIDGWWLRSNKFVNMGLIDARADDICGLSFYFKPSKKLIRAIDRLSK